MDLEKFKYIINWKGLETVIQVKLFLEFANYCRRVACSIDKKSLFY